MSNAKHQAAAVSLCDIRAIHSKDYRTKVSERENFALVNPRLKMFYIKFRNELQRRAMPIIPFEFYRPEARQQDLLNMGRTKAPPGQSPHNHGMAVDMVHWERFWSLSDEEWAVLGTIGKEVARKISYRNLDTMKDEKVHITWGGDWKFYDPAHWELSDWRSRIT